MSRQLGAALLVLVVSGAQASLAVCEIACAARDGQASADGSASPAHSCHRTQPSDGPVIDPGAQACGHDEELPTAAQAANGFALAETAASPVTAAIDTGAIDRAHAAIASFHGSPRVTVPLRI